jgi:N-methylhydantoinase A/oxoprolinase/acetone carboxylase beta subunit
VRFAVVHRQSLEPGATIAGPLIVLEETATTYVDAGFELEVHGSGHVLVRARERALRTLDPLAVPAS